MTKKPLSEKELLEGLDVRGAHADELVEPFPHVLTPLERLKDSVKRFERPTDPIWEEYFDSDGDATEDSMEDRDQPLNGRE